MIEIPKKVSRRFLLAVIVAALFFSWVHSAPIAHADVYIASSSLQALYHFNNQDLADSSGKGRDGVQGSSTFIFATSSAKLGAAAGDDQNTGFFTPTSPIMALTADFTLGFQMPPTLHLSSDAYFS